jgi:hypothetical protein
MEYKLRPCMPKFLISFLSLICKYVFASFVGRDGTYDLLTSIWRLSHPDSRSPEGPSDYETGSLSSGSYSDDQSFLSDQDEARSLKSSPTEDDDDAQESAGLNPLSAEDGGNSGANRSAGDIGPESHEKTECDCGKGGHYDKVVCDEVVKAPLGKVWNCVYGESKDFMMSFLRDNQKVQGMSPSKSFPHSRHNHG